MEKKCMDKSFKQIDNSKFEYVYISLVDLNGKYYMFGDTQLKWMLQDLGYPLFGVFNPEPNYDVFDYCRFYDAEKCAMAFGWRFKGVMNNA